MAATTTNEDDFIDAQKALKTFGWRAYAVDLDDLAKSPVIAEAGILVRPTDKLAQAYQKFLKCLPQGHEAKIEDGPPRLEVILEALADAENAWKNNKEKTKAGGMTTLFSKVAMNLNRYRELFAIVPSSDKYVSLVAGSISAIIKVQKSATRHLCRYTLTDKDVQGNSQSRKNCRVSLQCNR